MNQFKLYIISGVDYGKNKTKSHSSYISSSADIYSMSELLNQKSQDSNNVVSK